MGGTENLFPPIDSVPPEAVALPPATPPAPRDIWTLRDLLLFLAFIPFALLAANLVGIVGYIIFRPIATWRTPLEALPSNTFFVLTLQTVIYFLVVGYMLLMARIKHHQPFWKSLGWRNPTAKQVLAYLVGGGMLAVVISLAPTLLPDTKQFPLEQLFTSPAAAYAIGVFAVGIAPVVEELVFRGLLFAILERAVGLRFAVAATALLFAGLHLQEYWHAWNHLLMITVVGVVFSVARGKSASLTPSIFLHVGYNACMMASLYFSTQHFHSLNLILCR